MISITPAFNSLFSHTAMNTWTLWYTCSSSFPPKECSIVMLKQPLCVKIKIFYAQTNLMDTNIILAQKFNNVNILDCVVKQWVNSMLRFTEKKKAVTQTSLIFPFTPSTVAQSAGKSRLYISRKKRHIYQHEGWSQGHQTDFQSLWLPWLGFH